MTCTVKTKKPMAFGTVVPGFQNPMTLNNISHK